jgi:hypothetical protein
MTRSQRSSIYLAIACCASQLAAIYTLYQLAAASM